MSRKRPASKGHLDGAIPRKRHQKEKGDDYLVHLKYSDDVRVHDVVDFINRTMRKEWNSSIGRAGAIVDHRTNHGNGWILEAASTDLANKVCNLHGIYYKDQPLKIQKSGVLSSPSNWCWNDYYHRRHGKNDHFVDHHIVATILKNSGGGSKIDGSQLQATLNAKMEECKLASTNPIIKYIKTNSEDGNDTFLLCMRTERYANRLTYLNRITIDGHLVALKRLPEWKGEKPRFVDYDDFLNQRHAGEANRVHQKQANECAAPTSKDQHTTNASPVTIVIEDSKELEEAIAAKGSMKAIIAKQTAAAKDLRASLSIANDKVVQKDERIAKLEKVMEEQKQLGENDRESMKAIIAKQTADVNEVNESLKLEKDKSAHKDERIAQLEQIVEKQQKDLEDERHKVSTKEEEVDNLREDLSNKNKDLEEQHRIVATKEEETAQLHSNVADLSKELEGEVVKLNAVHQSWRDQVLLLDAKNIQLALLNAKLERINEAFLWQPNMDAIEKKAELLEVKGAIDP